MKKSNSIIVAIIIIVVLIVGGFAIFHKSSKTTTPKTAAKSTAAAINNAVLTTKTASNVGQYLADPSGKALYAFASDTSGVSNCSGSCLAAWPAYQDKGSTTNLPTGVSTIKRTDNGQIQYTYNGMPLYYFASDGSGTVTGNGVDNFQVAKPSAAASTQSTSNPSSSSSTSSQSSSNTSSGYNY
jgi:predicted lipoprotein with Yx(FWY)xxD motif